MFETKIIKNPYTNDKGVYGLDVEVFIENKSTATVFCAMNPLDTTAEIDVKIENAVKDYLKK